ncbi:hypothetical protein BDZ89DRAFT_719605 [Hymenopellis radicata]|nr:hypothetical protein BDZ89DRAFT_719605 [Hymenopellis radicata]
MSLQSRRRQIAAAVATRLADPTRRTSTAVPTASFQDHDRGHACRQRIRKMIDIDILGMVGSHPASKDGVESLKTLLALARGILDSPHDATKRRIKLNNNAVQKRIVQPKGVLQLAIEMGFCKETVEEMQAIRVFEASNLAHLETCAHLIHEAIHREQLRPDEHLVLKGKLEEQEEIRRQTMQRAMDDRKSVNARFGRQRSIFVTPSTRNSQVSASSVWS